MANELYCTNCKYTDTPERNHGNRCPKCGSRLIRPKEAKFSKGDKVLVKTKSSDGQRGIVTDALQDTSDGSWYYQVQVLFEDWVIAETDLAEYIRPKYSLDCEYYDSEFESLDELIDDIISSGMDPNYKITLDGKVTGDVAFNLIQV